MKTIFYIVFFLYTGVALSQNVPTLEVRIESNTVEEGEIFAYQLVANNDCPVTPPDFGEFTIEGGPETGYSSSSVSVNGKTTQKTEYTTTYYLRAPKKGTYSIGTASMKCKLKKVNSGQPTTVKVISKGQQNTTTNQSSNKGNYFFKLSADKSSVFVGEPFVLTFKYYSLKKPTQIESIELGNASGLWRTDLNPNRTNYTMTQENIKGQRFYVLELRKELCIPQRAGKITIDPYAGSLLIAIDFINNDREEGKSNSVSIDVKKLPGDIPPNANGLVGRFDLSADSDKDELVQGQSFTLSIKITGTGNLNAFDEPKLNLPEGFTTVDPVAEDETELTEQGLRGTVTYKYIITAEKPGDYELQPVTFSYFNLNEKKWTELSTNKISIHVEEGDENHGTIYKGQQPIDIENTDIQFIHQNKGITFSTGDFIFGTMPYFIMLLGPPFLVVLVALIRRRSKNISPETKSDLQKKSARKTALKNLSKSIQTLRNGQDKEAVKIVQNTLITYLMTKLNLSLSGLSLKSITLELEKLKIETDLLLELSHIWKKIEMAQYAPVSAENLEETVRATQKLIEQLDEKI
ncbi:MAG: protein BatD [Crocinitomicaceae bacterium]|nr:protein BatD [Crocinitomicaceae bacterium]MBK8926179.1 protein BatD [Crocinitomicaceae bacterium]